MSQDFSGQETPAWIQQRILDFFNRVKSWKEIVDTVLDDPSNNPQGTQGTSIGETVAKRILDHKASLPGKRFKEFSDLDGIQGLGADKLGDLVYTFGTPAAESFRKGMYNGVIFKENWDLQYRVVSFDTQAEFDHAVNCESTFTELVAKRVGEWVQERHNNRTLANTAENYVKQCWLEKAGSAHLASYYFAYYFYRTDENNWFSFDRVRQETEAYLEYSWKSEFELQLRFFKGFEMRGLLTDAITVPDLPVVINKGECQFEIWASSLSD